jgi:hypothetical protein
MRFNLFIFEEKKTDTPAFTFEQRIIDDIVGFILSFFSDRLLLRSLCKSLYSSISPQVEYLTVKDEFKISEIMEIFPNI